MFKMGKDEHATISTFKGASMIKCEHGRAICVIFQEKTLTI